MRRGPRPRVRAHGEPAHVAAAQGPATSQEDAPLGLRAGALQDLEDLALLELPHQVLPGGDVPLQRDAALAGVVGGALRDVHGALVALHGGPALLAITLGTDVHAAKFALGVLLRLLQLLQHLANLHLTDGHTLTNFKGAGDGNAASADKKRHSLEVWQARRTRFLERRPASLAVREHTAANTRHLQRWLPPWTLQELKDLPKLKLSDLRAGTLAYLMKHAGALCDLEDIEGLGHLFKKRRALIPLDSHPALYQVPARTALDTCKTCLLFKGLLTECLNNFTQIQLADGGAILHRKMRGERDLFDTPLVVLKQA
mmetsp:Transcript_112800/g.329593  ORF Transcript_112800/g.329593 Transcript_112800/m.329593 type:complete len:314 (-) Transcript_112800:4677-5618(-)